MEGRIAELTVPTTEKNEGETQTDNRYYEELVQTNERLKDDLQSLRTKVDSAIDERPELFEGVGEETGGRIDRLISVVKTALGRTAEKSSDVELK